MPLASRWARRGETARRIADTLASKDAALIRDFAEECDFRATCLHQSVAALGAARHARLHARVMNNRPDSSRAPPALTNGGKPRKSARMMRETLSGFQMEAGSGIEPLYEDLQSEHVQIELRLYRLIIVPYQILVGR